MNANQLSELVDVVRRLWETHVPAEFQVPVLPVAIGILVVGIGLSVLGAKLARSGITCGFAAGGMLIALALPIGLPLVVAVLVGTVVIGGIGYMLFRLWVGLAMAVFFAAVAAGAYGSHTVVPHLLTYESTHDFEGTFTLPDPSQTSASFRAFTFVESSETARSFASVTTSGAATAENVLSNVRAWADDFWLYVKEQEVDVNRRMLGIAMGAALFGLLLGMVLPRFTLIGVSAVVGTVLVMSGLAGMASHYQVDLQPTAELHGKTVAVAGIVFLFASVLLQAMLTRKASAPPRSQLAQ